MCLIPPAQLYTLGEEESKTKNFLLYSVASLCLPFKLAVDLYNLREKEATA